MCNDQPFTYPITGERLERLKARLEDGKLAYPEEWAQLIRQETPRLSAIIHARLRGYRNANVLAADALQRTWLDLMKHVGPDYSYRVPPDPENILTQSYIMGAPYRGAITAVCKDAFRYDHGCGEIDPEEDILNWLESKSFESEASILAAFHEMLDRAQPPLAVRDRKIVELHLFHGKTFVAIAAELQLSMGTVSSAYYRAIRQIGAGWPIEPPGDSAPVSS